MLLVDYIEPAIRHILDPARGLIAEARLVDEKQRDVPDARRNVVGFGCWKEIGLLRQRNRVFIAFYVSGSSLELRVGRAGFGWPDPALGAHRSRVFPGVKRFQLRRGREVVAKFLYRHVDRGPWPNNGDIFSHVERATRTPGEVARTIRFWAAHSEGRDVWTQQFQEELQRVAQEAERQSDL